MATLNARYLADTNEIVKPKGEYRPGGKGPILLQRASQHDTVI